MDLIKEAELFLITSGCQRMNCDEENCDFFEDVQPKDLVYFATKYIDNLFIKLEYDGKKNAGEMSKLNNVAVGEIGCKSCGVTIFGAIMQNKCMWCGENLI